MSSSKSDVSLARDKSVLVVGVGGLGCPAALCLVRAGVGRLLLADDDLVEEANLHRQILFSELDVGSSKLDAARRTLLKRGGRPESIELVPTRVLPDNARELVSGVDIVVEGSDNYATKFLVADACQLEEKPVVHGAAIRWAGTAWLVQPGGRPCYRCLFEDVPPGAQQGCSEAGVMGPVVGIVGALMADLCLRQLEGDTSAAGLIHTYDGWRDRLRAVEVRPRPNCPLCGEKTLRVINESMYVPRACSA